MDLNIWDKCGERDYNASGKRVIHIRGTNSLFLPGGFVHQLNPDEHDGISYTGNKRIPLTNPPVRLRMEI